MFQALQILVPRTLIVIRTPVSLIGKRAINGEGEMS